MRFLSIAVALVLAVTAAACAKPKAAARVEPEAPPLDIPAAPPRFVAPPAEEEEESAADAAEAPTNAGRARRPPSRPAPKPDAAAVKEELPKTDPAKPTEEPAAQKPAAPEPTPQLRTPQTADQTATERRIQDALVSASRALNSVNYAALNPDAKAQYDTAKNFIQQADEALKARNYVYATYLSDKAQTLARGLTGK